jgi:hypothetical protein
MKLDTTIKGTVKTRVAPTEKFSVTGSYMRQDIQTSKFPVSLWNCLKMILHWRLPTLFRVTRRDGKLNVRLKNRVVNSVADIWSNLAKFSLST